MLFEIPDLKLRNPYLSIALDEALSLYFSKQESFQGGIRFWANHYTTVLGRTCNPKDNLNEEFLKKFRVSHRKSEWLQNPALCRRASGGGTVLHGPGSINFSLFFPLKKFPELFPVKRSYEILLGMIIDALKLMDVKATFSGQSDIAVTDSLNSARKISGNAQFRKHGILVHHGTLITDKEIIPHIVRFLNHPPKEPDYRKKRNHADFLGSLPEAFDVTAFYHALKNIAERQFKGNEWQKLTYFDRKIIFRVARKMVREIYGDESWILEGKLNTPWKMDVPEREYS